MMNPCGHRLIDMHDWASTNCHLKHDFLVFTANAKALIHPPDLRQYCAWKQDGVQMYKMNEKILDHIFLHHGAVIHHVPHIAFTIGVFLVAHDNGVFR